MSDEKHKGVVVVSLVPDCPAERAGVRIGDRVIGINDHAVATLEDYVALRDGAPFESTFQVMRGNAYLEFTVRIDPRDSI